WDGGTIRSLRVSPTRLRLEGTITRPGASPDTPLGATRLGFVVADANDPASILFTESIPADHFTTRGTHTTYDRLGTFPGRVTLRHSKKQAGTVVVSIRVAAAVVGVGMQRDLRVSFDAGGRSART